MQVTFEVGADPDIAQVNVQNRVALAQPQLPEEVVRQGISVRKQSTNLLLVINLTSPNKTYDSLYLSNYGTINLLDALSRVPGVGQATIFGARDYSMRMWLDAGRMASLGIATSDVVRAVREQNVQVAAGQIGGAPSDPDQQFQYTIRTQGRLDDVGAFENIIVRARPDGSSVRIRDIARVELGARNYASFGLLNGNPSPTSAYTNYPAPTRLPSPTGFRRRLSASRSISAGPEGQHPLRHNTLRRRVDQGSPEDAAGSAAAGGAGRLRLPAGLANDGHPDDRHPGLADRNSRRWLSASTSSRCSAWCCRSASSSTTRSSSSRTYSAS